MNKTIFIAVAAAMLVNGKAIATNPAYYKGHFEGLGCHELKEQRAEENWAKITGRADAMKVGKPKSWGDLAMRFITLPGEAHGATQGPLNEQYAKEAWQAAWEEQGCPSDL